MKQETSRTIQYKYSRSQTRDSGRTTPSHRGEDARPSVRATLSSNEIRRAYAFILFADSKYRKIKISCLKSHATLYSSETDSEIQEPKMRTVRAALVQFVGSFQALAIRLSVSLPLFRADPIAGGAKPTQRDRFPHSQLKLTGELASAICASPTSSCCQTYREAGLS